MGALQVGGAMAVVYGVGLIYPPAAWIVVGAGLLALGLALDRA